MANQVAHLDRAFHALSDATRRAIVARLVQGPASVTELSKPFGMAKPTMLEHVRVLERSGLIATAKLGRVRTCEIKPEALAATEAWLARQRSLWEARLDRMDAYVTQLHAKETKRGKRNQT